MYQVSWHQPDTKVVCEGYSKAFQYLCDLSGFDGCYTVSGMMRGGTGAGPHMWNIVTLEGKNYLVDVTNCDGNSIGAPDKLFLAGASGSVETGYTCCGVTYTYDKAIIDLFESIGIALAYYLGIRFPIKYPHQLPGVTISCSRIRCIMIIIDKFANLFPKALKLLIV